MSLFRHYLIKVVWLNLSPRGTHDLRHYVGLGYAIPLISPHGLPARVDARGKIVIRDLICEKP
jgi:hypothetical protein